MFKIKWERFFFEDVLSRILSIPEASDCPKPGRGMDRDRGKAMDFRGFLMVHGSTFIYGEVRSLGFRTEKVVWSKKAQSVIWLENVLLLKWAFSIEITHNNVRSSQWWQKGGEDHTAEIVATLMYNVKNKNLHKIG